MGDLHAYPLNDLREHDTESKDCSCNPVIEVNGASLLVIHKAWDCREAVEMAKEILYCKPKGERIGNDNRLGSGSYVTQYCREPNDGTI